MELIPLTDVAHREPVSVQRLGKTLKPEADYNAVWMFAVVWRPVGIFSVFLLRSFAQFCFMHRDDLRPRFMPCVKLEQIGSANTRTAGTRWPTERWLWGSAGMWWALVWVTTMRGDQTGTWVGFQTTGRTQRPLCRRHSAAEAFLFQHGLVLRCFLLISQEKTRHSVGAKPVWGRLKHLLIYFSSVVIQNAANRKSCVHVLYFIIPFWQVTHINSR